MAAPRDSMPFEGRRNASRGHGPFLRCCSCSWTSIQGSIAGSHPACLSPISVNLLLLLGPFSLSRPRSGSGRLTTPRPTVRASPHPSTSVSARLGSYWPPFTHPMASRTSYDECMPAHHLGFRTALGEPQITRLLTCQWKRCNPPYASDKPPGPGKPGVMSNWDKLNLLLRPLPFRDGKAGFGRRSHRTLVRRAPGRRTYAENELYSSSVGSVDGRWNLLMVRSGVAEALIFIGVVLS